MGGVLSYDLPPIGCAVPALCGCCALHKLWLNKTASAVPGLSPFFRLLGYDTRLSLYHTIPVSTTSLLIITIPLNSSFTHRTRIFFLFFSAQT